MTRLGLLAARDFSFCCLQNKRIAPGSHRSGYFTHMQQPINSALGSGLTVAVLVLVMAMGIHLLLLTLSDSNSRVGGTRDGGGGINSAAPPQQQREGDASLLGRQWEDSAAALGSAPPVASPAAVPPSAGQQQQQQQQLYEYVFGGATQDKSDGGVSAFDASMDAWAPVVAG